VYTQQVGRIHFRITHTRCTFAQCTCKNPITACAKILQIWAVTHEVCGCVCHASCPVQWSMGHDSFYTCITCSIQPFKGVGKGHPFLKYAVCRLHPATCSCMLLCEWNMAHSYVRHETRSRAQHARSYMWHDLCICWLHFATRSCRPLCACDFTHLYVRLFQTHS